MSLVLDLETPKLTDCSPFTKDEPGFWGRTQDDGLFQPRHRFFFPRCFWPARRQRRPVWGGMVAEPDRASTAPFRANRDYRTIFQAPNPTTKKQKQKTREPFWFSPFPIAFCFICLLRQAVVIYSSRCIYFPRWYVRAVNFYRAEGSAMLALLGNRFSWQLALSRFSWRVLLTLRTPDPKV